MDRDVLIEARTGSANYNLLTPTSDVDMKYFTMPTFEDLYYKKSYKDDDQSDTFDYTVHDVRRLVELFWKANIAYLEVLFSVDYKCKFDHPFYESFSDFLLDNRERIARMNLPYLYDACVGMYFQKRKSMTVSSPAKAQDIAEHGYNRKDALHAFRIANFLRRYAHQDFQDFGKAIWYEDTSDDDDLLYYSRDTMLSIKNGDYTLEVIDSLLEDEMEFVATIKDKYKMQEPDLDMKHDLEILTHETVRYYIKEELGGEQ